MDTADRYLRAELQERRFTGLRRVARWVLTVVMAATVNETPAMFELVVTRVDTGAEVLRTVADLGDPGHLLEQVENDLRTLSVAEFAAEWHLPDEGRAA